MNNFNKAIQEQFKKLMKQAPQFGVSLFVHLIAFSLLALWVIETQGPAKVATVFSDIEEQKPQEDFTEEMKDEEIDLETPVSLSPGSASSGPAAASELQAMGNPTTATVQTAAAAAVLTDRAFNRPLSVGAGDMGLDSNVSGLKGDMEGGLGGGGGSGDGGDGGAIDKITLEILRQLSKNKVLVCWIMDSTESLKPRREAIAQKFDRVYHELDQLGVNKDEALMTAIVGTGTATKFATENPTNDIPTIRKAIRGLADDGSGIENLFTSIRETAMKYRRFQTSGRRTLMIVLLTDEIGDDLSQADETTALLKRNQVPLYCLGPMAIFGRDYIHELWIDPKTKFRFHLPMKRGPYTRQEEVLRVPFHWNRYSAGFGPFAMTQITRETGGIFFIYTDERIPPANYHKEVLMRYMANYGDAKDYMKEITTSTIRRTLMDCADQGNRIWEVHHRPYPWIREQVWKEELEQRQREVATFQQFAEKAMPMMDKAAEEWERETSPRWSASFDLSYARLMHAKVQTDEYNWACADFKLNPRTLKDPKNNNGWRINWVEEMRHGTKPGAKTAAKADEKAASTNVTKGGTNAKEAEENRKMLEKAMFHFQRVLDKHAGTPWAEAAKAEMTRKVGVDWLEGFDADYVRLEDRKARAAVKPPKL